MSDLTPEQRERRREQNRINQESYRAKTGRPKKYDSDEARNEARKRKQRKEYRKIAKKKRDLSTLKGRIDAWHDLHDTW